MHGMLEEYIYQLCGYVKTLILHNSVHCYQCNFWYSHLNCQISNIFHFLLDSSILFQVLAQNNWNPEKYVSIVQGYFFKSTNTSTTVIVIK